MTRVANYLNVVGMVFAVFLLASFAFLPVAKTHRHYLSVSLVIGVVLMQVRGPYSLTLNDSNRIHSWVL